MWKLPDEYKEKELLYRRLIVFTLLLGFVLGLMIVYMPQILGLMGEAIWVCLPFILGSILTFVLLTFCRVLMHFGEVFLHIPAHEKFLNVYKVITLLIIGGFLTLLIAFIIPQIASSAEKLARELPASLNQMLEQLYGMSDKIPFIHKWLENNADLWQDMPSLVSRLTSFLFAGSMGGTFQSIQNVLSSTFSWIWIFLLSVAFSIVAFFNTTTMAKEARLIARAFIPERFLHPLARFLSMVSGVFAQYLGGTVLECIILATLCSILGLLFQIPYAVLIGVFCGLCALVPMFGATAGALFCSFLLSLEYPTKAVTFLIMFLLLQQVEGNFIYPNVVGKSVGLPPMFVIIAVTIGASLAGILGMVMSIPIASLVYGILLDKARLKTGESKEFK